ncbi:MAG TPA: sigma-70 family RNA polymerase sigma factor [Mycobacteriales bacterium]|nr:sigma-70 family RNA polymerase sigma factor [Mycobacteriales bacterium]
MTLATPVIRISDVGGYEALFHAHFDGMVRFASLLGADDAADVAQEAFVRLHRRRHTLRDEAAALPYLRRTVANLTRSRQRHLGVVQRVLSRSTVEHHPSAEDSAVGADERNRVLLAIMRLPARQRELLVLRYWLDLTGPEIAATLGLPLGTVKSGTSRALDALARLMET